MDFTSFFLNIITYEIFYAMIIINLDCKKITKALGFTIFLLKSNVFDIRRDDTILSVVFPRILHLTGDE